MRKDILLSSAGIAGGQGILLLATPFLARLYTPAQFGEYATVVAAAGIIATIASLRFDVALPAVDSKDVRPLFHLALGLVVLVSIGLACVIGFLPSKIDLLADFAISQLLSMCALALFLGAFNVCQARLVRAGDFKWVALLKIMQPAIFAFVAFLAVTGLLASLAASWLIVVFFSFWACRKEFDSFDFRSSFVAAKKARKYPFLSAPMALLDTASLALPLFFVAAAFGDESAGNFSQVQRLLGAPLILLGLAANQVFFKHAGDLHRRGDVIEPLLRRVVLSLSALGLALLITTSLLGEPLLHFLLGDGWRTDLEFLLLALSPVIFRMIVSPVSCIFLIKDQLWRSSVWQATYFFVTAGTILIAFERTNFESYLYMLACSEFVMYSAYLGLSIFAARAGSRAADVKAH